MLNLYGVYVSVAAEWYAVHRAAWYSQAENNAKGEMAALLLKVLVYKFYQVV